MGAVMQGLAGKPDLAGLLHRLAGERGICPWESLSLKELVHQAASPAETTG